MSDRAFELPDMHNLLLSLPPVSKTVSVQPLVTGNANPLTAGSMSLLINFTGNQAWRYH